MPCLHLSWSYNHADAALVIPTDAFHSVRKTVKESEGDPVAIQRKAHFCTYTKVVVTKCPAPYKKESSIGKNINTST